MSWVICLCVIAVIPATAAADPLDKVLAPAALGHGQVVLDEGTLSDIRGRGAEGPDITVGDVGDVAVILWDELKRPGQQGRSGTSYSQTSGRNNAQTSTLTLTRY